MLAAHVSYNGERGPITHLQDLATGAVIRVRRGDGSVHAFRVDSRRKVVKSALDRQDLFRTTGPPVLALVAYGGAYDAATRNPQTATRNPQLQRQRRRVRRASRLTSGRSDPCPGSVGERRAPEV